MRRLIIFLLLSFLLLAFSAQAQRMGVTASSKANGALVVDTDVTTLTAEDFKAGDRSAGEINAGPFCIYNDGKTFHSYPMRWDSDYMSFGMLTYYDKDVGFYPAPIELTRKGGEVERHLQPVISTNSSDEIFTIQEQEHIGAAWTTLGEADHSAYRIISNTQALAARHNVFQTSTGWAVLYQREEENIYVMTCDENGENWSAAAEIVDGAATARAYMQTHQGSLGAIDGWYRILVTPLYETGGSTRKVKFMLKTQDFTTWYNEAESHSFTAGSPLSYALLTSNNYVVIGSTASAVDYGTCPFAVTPAGKPYVFSWRTSDFGGAEVVDNTQITTSTWEGGAWVNRTADLGVPIMAGNAVGHTSFPTWALAKSDGEIYLLISLNRRPHIIKTTDKGASWTDISGDMIPGKDFYRATGPVNGLDIPDNTNFVFWFNEGLFDNVSPFTVDLYAVKAAFGEVQEEDPQPFTQTLTTWNELTGARAIYESDDWDNTVTGFFDKSGSGNTGVKIGTPAKVGNVITFNGTNQGIDLQGIVVPFRTDNNASVTAVAKWVSGTAPLINFSRNGSADYVNVALTSTGLFVRHETAGTVNDYQFTVAFNTSVLNIIQLVCDNIHFRVYVNGVEMVKTYNIEGATADLLDNGKWGADVTGTLDRSKISVRTSNGVNTWGGMQLAAWGYWPFEQSRENRKKELNFLANKYSISVTNYIEN